MKSVTETRFLKKSSNPIEKKTQENNQIFDKNSVKIHKKVKKFKNFEKPNVFFLNQVKCGKYARNHDHTTLMDKKNTKS